jgi:hypothetical protein
MAKKSSFNRETESVAAALQVGTVRERVMVHEYYENARLALRNVGVLRTEDDISFFDDSLDMDHLDEVVASLRD